MKPQMTAFQRTVHKKAMIGWTLWCVSVVFLAILPIGLWLGGVDHTDLWVHSSQLVGFFVGLVAGGYSAKSSGMLAGKRWLIYGDPASALRERGSARRDSPGYLQIRLRRVVVLANDLAEDLELGKKVDPRTINVAALALTSTLASIAPYAEESSEYVPASLHETTGIHSAAHCAGPCPLHRPTVHEMRVMALQWSTVGRAFVRVCDHGLLHPDPDDSADNLRSHGDLCDGCCGYRVREGGAQQVVE